MVVFTPSSEEFMNPERGLFLTIDMLSPEILTWVRGTNGYSLVRGIIRLNDYLAENIPQGVLDDIETSFNNIRTAEIKVIIKVYYADDGVDQDDTTLAWMSTHIGQLAPLFATHEDVIYCFQAGYIGWWGEWHNSSNDLENTADRRTLLYDVLDNTPTSRQVQIRCPFWKWDIFEEKITANNAFDESRLTRTGHHNDGWISVAWGYPNGTYPSSWSEGEIRTYLEDESPYCMMGGESSGTGYYDNCTDADSVLVGQHYSYLNGIWHSGVWTELAACADEIQLELGYRIELQSMTIESSVCPGDILNLHLELENVGHAPFVNEHTVYFVLENGSHSWSYPLVTDPRYWTGEVIIDEEIPTLLNLPHGDYEMFLWMPDAFASLEDIPEYSVRCANEDVWQSETGYNLLGTITIKGQGGFGVILKIMVGTTLTAVANMTRLDFPQLEKIQSESSGHDSTGGYAEHIATGKYKANEFTCTLTWDSAESTHAAMVTALDAVAAVNMSIADPDSIETSSGLAHIRAITRISRQEDVYKAEVAIQPTGQWSIT